MKKILARLSYNLPVIPFLLIHPDKSLSVEACFLSVLLFIFMGVDEFVPHYLISTLVIAVFGVKWFMVALRKLWPDT